MKKICLSFVCLTLTLFFCGCTAVKEPATTDLSGEDVKAEDDVSVTVETEDANSSSTGGKTFYKLSIQEETIDEEEICSIWIPSFDTAPVTSLSNAEGAAKQITVDGITYSWIVNGNTFSGYSDTSEFGGVDGEKAIQLGEQFIKALGYQVNSVPTVSTDERGLINLEYTFQYDGVDILGNKILYIGQDDETGTSGTYLSLGVCNTGIVSVYISNFIQITAEVATYQEDIDFIGDKQAQALTEAYYDQLVGENGAFTAETRRTEIKLIYMPYFETGSRVLIPAYEVTASDSDGTSLFCAILDALTGYVYSAQ